VVPVLLQRVWLLCFDHWCGCRQQHCEVAKTSNMFVLYVQITPKPGQPTFEVAVPVTSGGKGNLCLSKRGVFYDVAGNECDAKVVHIIENPISFKEALKLFSLTHSKVL